MESDRSATPPTAADLRQLAADLAAAEHHIARAVVAAGRLAGSGVCERVEGLPLELFIGLAAHLPGVDRATIIGAGQVLRHMPATAQLFCDGALSWGQVRRITRAARTLRVAHRAQLDARIAASHQRWNGLDAFGPDQLCDEVDVAARELREPRSVERSEAASQQANFFSVQRSLLGRVQLFGDFDEVSAAPIVDMLDAAAGQPNGCGGAAEATDHSEPVAEQPAPTEPHSPPAPAPTRRGSQYAQALSDIAAAYLAGGLGATRARTLINAFVDLSQVHVNNAGMIELNVRGPIPRISLAALEALSADADCRVVLFDRKRPLAVSAKLHAKHIPTDVAFAVAARDMGDRWPGSNDPLGHTDNHHLTMRSHGGVHHIDDIVRLSRRNHRTHHQREWSMRLEPTTGMLTIKRGKRIWRSLPRGTPLTRPNPPPTDDDTAPPTRHRLPF